MRTVLIVEDERDIREVLRRYLERAGISVLTAATGAEALQLIESIRPDLVLLDLGLPDIDGSEILATVSGSTPVIVLTARSDAVDRIAGLRRGAEDYVVKPFSPTEVILRIEKVLARSGRPGLPQSVDATFGGGLLRIDEARHHASVADHELALTPHEWAVLVALAGDPGRVFSRRELVEHASGYTFEGYERAIDTHIKNLRRKLGPEGQRVIETVVGFGYRLGIAADG
jgi:DNA-binding response OmpR family regulator